MRPRLTWKVPSWTKAGWVDSHPEIVARFGPDGAGVVIRVRRMVEYRRDQPRSQDTRHTLQSIARSPASVDVRMLDDHVDAVLSEPAWFRHKKLDLSELTPPDLADCARAALEAHIGAPGHPETDDLAQLLVRELLQCPIAGLPELELLLEQMAVPAADRAAFLELPIAALPAIRDQVLSDALRACRLGYSQKNIERLRRTTG